MFNKRLKPRGTPPLLDVVLTENKRLKEILTDIKEHFDEECKLCKANYVNITDEVCEECKIKDMLQKISEVVDE